MSAIETLLSDLPQKVCDHIYAALPKLKTCETIAGKFNLEELKKQGADAPAVFVSVLKLKGDQGFAGAHFTYAVQMAAFIVTKNQMSLNRDVAAANICQTILALLPEHRWGLDPVGPAEHISAECLISTQSRSQGVSLWAITWTQPVSFEVRETETQLGPALYVAHANEGTTKAPEDHELIHGGAT